MPDGIPWVSHSTEYEDGDEMGWEPVRSLTSFPPTEHIFTAVHGSLFSGARRVIIVFGLNGFGCTEIAPCTESMAGLVLSILVDPNSSAPISHIPLVLPWPSQSSTTRSPVPASMAWVADAVR